MRQAICFRYCVFLFLLFSALPPLLSSQDFTGSPYFPESGPKAYRQYLNDLRSPVAILAVAVRPGEEDLATLAYYRLALGARVGIVYVTNGESLPGGGGMEDLAHLAARRKEEATAVGGYLDIQTRFLNLPDPGVLTNADELKKAWPADTLLRRMHEAISLEAPDIILLNCRSPLTLDAQFAEPSLEQAVREFGHDRDSTARVRGPLSGTGEVLVQKILSDSRHSTPSFTVPQSARNATFNKSYESVAREAAEIYKSLDPGVVDPAPRTYGIVYARTRSGRATVVSGIELPSPRMRALAQQVDRFSKSAGTMKGRAVLSPLADLISTLDATIRTESGSCTPGERRLLARWNHTLEDFRCAVLDVEVHYSLHDPVISRMQLFSFTFDRFRSSTTGGSTQIYFPQKSPDWIINTSTQKAFSFKAPQDFQVLSQQDVVYDTPTSEFGLLVPQLGTDLIFAIVHHGRTREENFIYQRAIRLRVGPKRSFELMNSVVSTLPPTWVAFKAVNYSRDAGEGVVGTADTLYEPVSRSFALPSWYSTYQDTIQLHLVKPVAQGMYRTQLRIPGNDVAPLLVRSFPCSADTGVRVGLVSRYPNGILAWSLRRLGTNWRLLNAAKDSVDLVDHEVIVVDEGVASPNDVSPATRSVIEAWVKRGGHLVLLPQWGPPTSALFFGAQGTFHPGSPMSGAARPLVDSTSAVVSRPNRLDETDWQDWIFAKAFGTIVLPTEGNAAVSLRNARQEPLVATIVSGKGTITYVSLNLDAQLLEAVPGAYRLLANLLSPL